MVAVHPFTMEQVVPRPEDMVEKSVQCGTLTTVGTKRKFGNQMVRGQTKTKVLVGIDTVRLELWDMS
jgi:hypothetical protein